MGGFFCVNSPRAGVVKAFSHSWRRIASCAARIVSLGTVCIPFSAHEHRMRVAGCKKPQSNSGSNNNCNSRDASAWIWRNSASSNSPSGTHSSSCGTFAGRCDAFGGARALAKIPIGPSQNPQYRCGVPTSDRAGGRKSFDCCRPAKTLSSNVSYTAPLC